MILFSLEEVDAPGGARAGRGRREPDSLDEDTREYDTFTGDAVAAPRQGVSRPQGHTRRSDEAPTARSARRGSDDAEAEYRASGTVALSAVRPRAQPIEEGQAARARPGGAAPRGAGAVRHPGRLLALGCAHRPAGRLLARDAPGLLRRRRRIPRQRRHPLPRPAVRPPARDPALLAGPPLRRDAPERARRAPRARSPTTSCAPRTTPRAWCSRSSRARISVSARNRELMALIPASLLLTAGFAAIFIQRNEVLSDVSLTYGGIFLGLCFAAHLVIRFTLPHADPYLFPLVAVLACFGLVVVYRIDEDLARDQAQWFVIGLIVFAVDDLRCCATSACSSATATRSRSPASRCCCCRACPGSASRSTAPTSASSVGPVSFQPAGARQDRDRHLPRRLPARHAPGAGAGLAPLPRASRSRR